MAETKNKKTLKIGLMGLIFDSGNLGCAALAHSFFHILLNELLNLRVSAEFFVFSNYRIDSLKCETNMAVKNWVLVEYHFRSRKYRNDVEDYIKQCDYIFDFTEGDGFTDLYGFKRWLSSAWIKYKSIKSDAIYVLGPQTYGPFSNAIVRQMAGYIVLHADYVYARDYTSAQYIYSLYGKKITTVTDVAFALPYKEMVTPPDFSIGLNISGLLWNNGYTGKNEFKLKVNYREYIESLIIELHKRGYSIHLIPHVVCKYYDSPDDDFKVASLIKQKYDYCLLADMFNTPSEAKGYISQMGFFIGARMHSTIAAFSAGVPVVPFSYSRKFEGLYNDLNYNYCIDGKKLDTNAAIEKTMMCIENRDLLLRSLMDSKRLVNEKLNFFRKELNRILLMVK